MKKVLLINLKMKITIECESKLSIYLAGPKYVKKSMPADQQYFS